MAGLLVEFTHIDRLNAVRNAQGKRLDTAPVQSEFLHSRLPAKFERRLILETFYFSGFIYFEMTLAPPDTMRTPNDAHPDYFRVGREFKSETLWLLALLRVF